MHPRSLRATVLLLAVLATVSAAGCAPLQQPTFRPEPEAERDRLRKEQRLDVLAAVGRADDPACTGDATRTYADVPDFVDRHTLIARENGDIEGEQSDTVEERFRQQFTSIMTAFEDSGKDSILIYVNGGLNPLDTVRNQAARQLPCMARDGYFPVFLIWQTGPFDTYLEQILRVRNGELKENLQATFPLYLAGDVGEGIVRSPVTLWNSVVRYWDSTAAVAPEYQVDEDIRKAGDPVTYPLYENVAILSPHEKEDTLAASELVHGLGIPARLATAPILDAMGKTAWENMLRRTRTTVRTVWELQPEFRGDSFDQQVRCFPRGTGVFAKFFQALQRYLMGPEIGADGSPVDHDECGIFRGFRKGKKHIKLTLIGHSMGAIVLNELIPAFPRLPYENIVYMAAASSIRDFQRSVPWVIRLRMRGGNGAERECPVNFYSLMLNPIAEARERTYKGLLLSGSLLEWIDDIYQNPKTMLDRTLGMWRNLRPALHVLDGEQRRCLSFRIFGFKNASGRERPGLHAFCDPRKHKIAHPQKHGDFNDDDKCFWQPRFWGAKPRRDG